MVIYNPVPRYGTKLYFLSTNAIWGILKGRETNSRSRILLKSRRRKTQLDDRIHNSIEGLDSTTESTTSTDLLKTSDRIEFSEIDQMNLLYIR